MRVLCIGDAVIDAFLTIKGDILIKPGEKIPVDSCQFLLGGNACNVSVGLSRLGVSSSLCAEIGDDEFSQKIINSLSKEGVDTSSILQTKGAMSSFAVSIQGKNDRTLFVCHVERKHDFDLANISPEWVYLSSMGKEWEGVYHKVLSLVKNSNIKLAFNPGTPQLAENSEIINQVLQKTDILFVNKEEAVKIANSKFLPAGKAGQIANMKEPLETLQKLGAKIVVVTNGENGSSAIDEKGKVYSFGVLPANVVQKTGAGDAYTAGFLAAKIYGKEIEEAMMWGSANAASVIGKIGAQKGLLTKDQLEERLKNKFEI